RSPDPGEVRTASQCSFPGCHALGEQVLAKPLQVTSGDPEGLVKAFAGWTTRQFGRSSITSKIDLPSNVTASDFNPDRLLTKGAVAQETSLNIELPARPGIRVMHPSFDLLARNYLGFAARLPFDHHNVDFTALHIEPVVAICETIPLLAWVLDVPLVS